MFAERVVSGVRPTGLPRQLLAGATTREPAMGGRARAVIVVGGRKRGGWPARDATRDVRAAPGLVGS